MKKLIIKISIGVLAVLFLLFIIFEAVIPELQERHKYVSMGKEWMSHLKQHPGFSAQGTGYPIDVTFLYSDSTDENLRRLRKQYDLDSIAGQGSETERIINLMTWVYGLAAHANEPAVPAERNAFSFIHLAKDQHMNINCYMKTVILNEVYLSMGFYSRHTHLLPYSHEEEESHFVTSVFSQTLDKWILMDPDFGAYVTDKKGNILGVAEIRRGLISGAPMKVHHVGRSGLEMAWFNLGNFIEGANYLWFLSEFVFKMRCPEYSRFAQDTVRVREFFELIPDGYKSEQLRKYRLTGRGEKIYSINDETIFWQKPAGISR